MASMATSTVAMGPDPRDFWRNLLLSRDSSPSLVYLRSEGTPRKSTKRHFPYLAGDYSSYS